MPSTIALKQRIKSVKSTRQVCRVCEHSGILQTDYHESIVKEEK